VSERTTKSGHFPADLLTLLGPYAALIGIVTVGSQRTWIILSIFGALLAAAAARLLRARYYLVAWLYLVFGIAVVVLAISFAIAPM